MTGRTAISSDPVTKEYEIETFTGRFVDTSDPRPSSIRLEDVAHALSNTCRYGGHCRVFYSVAEHAVFVSERLRRKGFGLSIQLAGLHHDDHEAYLGDIPRPMKPLLGGVYDELCARMDVAIVAALSFPFAASTFEDARIQDADNWSLFVEARYLLPSEGKGWGDGLQGAYKWELEFPGRIVTPDYWRGGLAPAVAETLFLERHKELMERITHT